jgi:hypothetical protein
MIEIKFLSKETQNAIYDVAHKYEGFEILDINDLVKSFYKNIEIKGSCEFGLEQAISDYLLFNNDFDINGRYHYIIDGYEGENRVLSHVEDNTSKNDNIINCITKKRKSAIIRDKYINLGKSESQQLDELFQDDEFWK